MTEVLIPRHLYEDLMDYDITDQDWYLQSDIRSYFREHYGKWRHKEVKSQEFGLRPDNVIEFEYAEDAIDFKLRFL